MVHGHRVDLNLLLQVPVVGMGCLLNCAIFPKIFAKHVNTHLFTVVFFLMKHALSNLCNI